MLAALAPAAFAGVFGLWAGTLEGGGTAAGAIAGHLLLLAAAVAAAPAWRDPLGLGRRGRLLPWALWLTTAAAAWASPVPRAGRVAVILLPVFLLLPAAVGRAWRGDGGRRWGTRSIAAVVAAGALWALWGRFAGGDPRAAAPLGHHLLLAVWLLALLPLAALPALREHGGWRGLGIGAAAAGVAALAAAGSLAGLAGLALEGGLAALAVGRSRAARGADSAGGLRARAAKETVSNAERRRAAIAVTVGLAGLAIALPAALALPRLARLAAGEDLSARARAVYARAGLAGIGERPALGWGPGSTPWTLAEHLRPVPGVDPPGEMVAELHALPLQLGYELGIPGLLLAAAIAVLFARRRLAETAAAAAPDPALARAGLIGLAGAGVALLATGWLAVTALPVALAVTAGAALAGTAVAAAVPAGGRAAGAPAHARSPVGPPVPAERRAAGGAPRPARVRWLGRAPAVAYALAAAALLAPPDLAHLAYDRALAAGDPAARSAAFARAVRLDPSFPLYRARLAWAGEGSAPPAAVAGQARRAAADAFALAPFWLAAGVHGAAAGEPWAAAALERACDLDPLGALAPFHRAALEPDAPGAAAAVARSLLAEPRLAAAVFFEGREPLLAASLDEVLAWEGVDPGWREELVRQVAGWDPAVPGDLADLALRLDPSDAESITLRSFRRQPQPLRLAPVTLRARLAEQVGVPPATTLGTTSAAAFTAPGCGAPRLPADPSREP